MAENGVYSEANMGSLNQAKIPWISRVSETSTAAQTALAQNDETRQASTDGNTHWVSQILSVPQGKERWVILSTSASHKLAQATMQRKATRAHAEWKKTCRRMGTHRCACETDAQAAREQEKKGKPFWLDVSHHVVARARHAGRGRPRTEDSPPTHEWHVVATVTINQLWRE